MKIFKLNDCDWFAAETLEAAIECAKTECGYGDDDIDDPYQLTEEDMDRLQFRLTDDDDQPLEIVSFREALRRRLAAGERFPYIFASTEA